MKYFLIALVLISCNNSNETNQVTVPLGPLDTIHAAPGVRTSPVLFEGGFINGTTHQVDTTVVKLYGITIGKLKVTSGKIIACDPMHIDEYGIPFTQQFPTGEFPVQLSIANVQGLETVAFARINFNNVPVVRWELALQKGQEPLPIDSSEMHGYSVDGGIGIFMDEQAVKSLDQTNSTDLEGKMYEGLNKNRRNGWRYDMYQFGNYNMAQFSSGFGDGFYASYIGFDANGKPCRLLTDFGLFNWKNK